MVSQAQLIYCCFITGYMFRPTYTSSSGLLTGKGKGLPQQAEVAQGVPGRLRPRIFLTFDIRRVLGCQLYAPAAFTPGEILGTHF